MCFNQKWRYKSLYYGSETKRKENTEAKIGAKRKVRKRNKAKRKIRKRNEAERKNGSEKRSEKKNTEAIQSAKKNTEANETKRSEKIDAKISLIHAKRKQKESRFASFRFEAKKNCSETGATLLCSALN
jgi:hypothetical protein